METIIEHVKEMLSLRGDDLTNFIKDEQKYVKKDFYVKTQTKYPSLCTDKTCIIFCLIPEYRKILFDEIKTKTKSVEPKSIDEIVNTFIDNHDNMLNYIVIFTHNKKLTTVDKNIFLQFDKYIQKHKEGIFQDFYETSFMFNPTKHELVPEHRKLNINEIKELMHKYMVNSRVNLPFILKSDPIAKWFGLKVGDIVEIKHYNVNSGLTYYYRCCT